MHKSATKCNETIGKWCKNKHGASKIIDMFETYQGRDAHMNSSKCELICNHLCQLYDPMSAISFMRECTCEPMNPGPLLIIRNNFPFTLSLFYF
jgi:hypothetical protein